MKPYPFYDWVETARAEIEERGETPVALGFEPSGAELAHPQRSFTTEKVAPENPDPAGRIHRDKDGFITARTVVVPSRVKPGKAVRVHVLLTPDAAKSAHWNNEVEDTVLWVDPATGWEVDRQRLSAPRPEEAISSETRRLEFELRAPVDAEPGMVTVPAYALYYVCEDIDGKCLYRRQDLHLEIPIVR